MNKNEYRKYCSTKADFVYHTQKISPQEFFFKVEKLVKKKNNTDDKLKKFNNDSNKQLSK